MGVPGYVDWTVSQAGEEHEFVALHLMATNKWGLVFAAEESWLMTEYNAGEMQVASLN